MSDAFDADVIIYASTDTQTGSALRKLIDEVVGPLGSVVLLPETLSKPLRDANASECEAIRRLLSRFDLKEVDLEIADAAATLAAKYRLRAADAIHLATAVVWGAERFHTNNRKDFGPHIQEVEVVWPATS
ncbi:MAG: PIN domain-containing protein [Salinibacterium sp.]|nr:MAG: PIN domain-containing protein [Salinibacterium sp.]